MVIRVLNVAKLLATAFFDETPRAIARRLVRCFQRLLFSKPKQGAVIFRPPGQPASDTPQIWFAIQQLYQLKRYEELYVVGDAVVRDGLSARCPSPEYQRALIMIGIAAYSKPNHDFKLADKLLSECATCTEHDEIRLRAHVNLTQLHILENKLQLADRDVTNALAIRESYDAALLNGLCVASRMKSRSKCASRAQLLLVHHPEANDPRSFLGGLIVSDDDLTFFRSTKLYAKYFPGLAEASVPVAVSAATIAIIILIALSLVPLLGALVQATAISVGG